MKKLLIVLSSLLFLAGPSWADDTDIYGVSSINIKPNVLIIFDNSGSMGTADIPGTPYNPATSYAGTFTTNDVYKSGASYFVNINSANWQCAAAKSALQTQGWWKGKLKKSGGIVTCGGSTSSNYRLGNFENYDALSLGAMRTRMEVAKEVIGKLISDNYDKVNFGLMKFNTHNNNYTTALGGLGTEDNRHESGYIVAGCGASKAALLGTYDPASPPTYTDNNQAGLGYIGAMYSDTYTPLSETLTEAGIYFSGKTSWFNGSASPYTYTNACTKNNSNCYTYTSPIQYRCQKNFVIIMTDGDPTRDQNPQMTNDVYLNTAAGRKIPYASKDGVQYYLDDVAYYLAQNDLRVPGATPSAADLLAMGEAGDYENQTVTTYTIGFKATVPLLINTANNGGGKYYTADNADTLNEALNSIITAISESNESFSAAAVPVSRANKAYSGSYVYYGLFQPLSTGEWVGNLKKYSLNESGQILGADGVVATSNGQILDTAKSYWSATPDGPSTGKGGAGAKLLSDIEGGFSRKIYTYTGTSTTLTAASNLFTTTNAALTGGAYAGLTSSVIEIVRREDGNWPLGDLLHSQPTVVHYDDNGDGTDDHSMIFVGANDGMLHCFDDNDGSEKWAFIPPDLLGNLDLLAAADNHPYFVDGTPVLYTYDHDNNTATPKKKLLFFGERRGGESYTALDITDYNSPLLKYSIDMTALGAGAEMLGQSWGRPQLVRMGYKDGITYKTKEVFFMTGGYDDNQDSLPPAAATDSKGRAVFAIDAQTGALLTNFSFNFGTFPSMTHSIVAAAAFESPKTITATRVYAGDLNGTLFAFRDDTDSGAEDGVWSQRLKLFSDPGKKIFYAPNIVYKNFDITITDSEGHEQTVKRVGDYVFYGTGDREHPDETATVNSFYAIKNSWQWRDSADHDTETPTIVKAYVDKNDGGKIKKRSDNTVLVEAQRNSSGQFISNVESKDGTLFIIDVYSHLAQQNTEDATQLNNTNYAKDALRHPSNRGWYFDLVEANADGSPGAHVGEKVVATPFVYSGTVYFSTYIPESGEVDVADPCANPGARGTGYLYQLNYEDGAAMLNNPSNDSGDNEYRQHEERRGALPTKGIPPEPVMIFLAPSSADPAPDPDPGVLTGYDMKPGGSGIPMHRFYWRQIFNQ